MSGRAAMRIGPLEEVVRRHSIDTPGGYAAIALARHDGLLASASFLNGERLDAPRRSSVASITKPITASAVLQLVEAGDVALDEPISTYVAEFEPMPLHGRAGSRAVTVRHVLSHTAGLSDVPDADLRTMPSTPAAMLDAVCRQRLRFEPGTAYAYASEPWYLLSALIERVSGTPYAEYLRERILEPLGMTATGFDPRDPGPEPLPPEGTFPIEDVTPGELVALGAALTLPGGGLWSTPEDVATFGRALLRGGSVGNARILGPASIARMTQPETHVRMFETGETVHYGLGLGLPGLSEDSPASRSAFGHTGATGSALLVDPANDLVVVYLRNWWGVSMSATDEAIAAAYAVLP